MKTTLKNNLSNFSLVFLLTLLSFNSCSKDETISTTQKQGQIKVEIKESINNVDLKNQVEKNLSKIKQIFEIAPPKSMRKSSGKGTENDPINLEDIQIKTEAYNSIKNENGKVSYTFEVDFPTDNTNLHEIINLHTYYDENNQLKSQLIKYELTNEELLVATNNQSFDGFWDKISYLDLETTDIDSNSKKNTSARSGDTCSCEDDGPATVIWVPYSNNSGYGGPSASGVGYALPPLNSLPPNVMAALQAAGVFVGINYNNFAPYGYGHNYTTPVQYFSTNDLTIPAYNPSSSASPFNNYYAYYFSGIKNVIKDYYEKVYVSQINSYVTSSQTTLVDHIVKQKIIYDFFQFTFTLYAQNRTQFYYLSSDHELTENIFYFLAEKNNGSFYEYTQAKTFAENTIEAMMDTTSDIDSFNDIVLVDGPENPITDLTDFFECFDATQDAVVTVYAKEPIPGSGDANDGSYVGHSFVSISQGVNTSVFGYYPVSDWISPLNTSGTAVLGNDGSGNENFTASISTSITGAQLQQIINASINFTSTYNLNNYNCTDFGIEIGNLGGLGLPAANGTWPGGSGSNPGALGLYIRNLTPPAGVTTNTTAGNAPATHKGC
ncbi:hypothetical protein FORMB_15470 [Formosa sp. Hel1_33_131]|uniref:hypothetical protein n=1 Tax=Formosa sp. Hel1_33_131 TaxID=1336794 RepID=UPI00084E0C5B|nr:hypothetical protein [Formosa sp. Hel1_33_131]AOR28587.1 hypothetical protein FORMB_15470 [Formosa sp. Hel1_33_131]